MKRLPFTAVCQLKSEWPINHEEGSAKSIFFQCLRNQMNNEWARVMERRTAYVPTMAIYDFSDIFGEN